MGAEVLIPAGASLLGGFMSSKSASKAADSQSAAQAAAIDEQRRQYDQSREDLAPWRQAGGNALQQLLGGIGNMPTQDEVMQSPGYQFGLSEGQRALDRRQAAAGGRISGAAMRRGARYATDYATQGYNSEYQRRQDTLNRLASLAGIGQTATGASAAAGSNSANAISGMLMQGGQNAGAAQLAQGNIWGNALNDLGAQYAYNQRRQQPSSSYSYQTRPYYGSGLDGFFGGTGGSGD